MVRACVVLLAFFVVGVTSCSVAYSQSLDFRIDGPTEVDEGEYVELRVEFPEGVPADVSFVPVDEDRFGVHPVVLETIVDGKLVPVVTGRVCTFSARCQGERDLTVVATAFASVDCVPRIHSLRHRIRVKAVEVPEPPKRKPPEETPPRPPTDDDLGPRVPLPSDASSSVPSGEDLDKIVRILGDVVDRLETLEKRTSFPAERTASIAKFARATPAPIADAKPGHWSVATATDAWRPTKTEAMAHLRQAHAATALRHEPLEALSIDEVLTLHDDAHEGRAASISPSPAQRYVAPLANVCPGGVCPGGVSPTSPRSSYTTGPLGVIRWRR